MPHALDILARIDGAYPLARAEAWDKVGLLIGDGAARVSRLLVAHEVTEQTIEEAEGYEAMLTYHPLLFRPLENLDFADHTARLAASCIARKVAVMAVHTALDNAPPPFALGDELAQSLELREVRPLQPTGVEALFKIVVFTPPEALDNVSAALWDAGAGRIGNYDQASFRARGTGTFRPLPGAKPYDGEVGRLEEADEWRVEVIVPQAQRDACIRAMIEAHPYEEVAYDVHPLHNTGAAYGAARMGVVQKEQGLGELALHVAGSLRTPDLRVVPAVSIDTPVRKVACVCGSGAAYITAAARAGCDLLVTGDIKHHDALKARALGLSIVDATHVATERAAVGMMADALEGLANLEVTRSLVDTNPFSHLGAGGRGTLETL